MRLHRTLAAAAAIVGLATGSVCAQSLPTGTRQLARLTFGSIRGIVSDERGGPVSGAMVSALGATTAMAITDGRGRFFIDALPPGEYVLRVHMAGFTSSRRDAVRVGTVGAVVDPIQLHRADAAAALGGRPILTAGVDLPQPETTDATDDHSHGEVAWRLRHIKRSVLKQEGGVATGLADTTVDDPVDAGQSLFGRAVDTAAGAATSFFTETPFTGELNFLTTSAFGARQLFATDFVPRGVAYITIGAPLPGGRWDVRASMSQSDTSAWILAGTMNSHLGANHAYSAGVSYSAQQYVQGNLKPLAPQDSPDGNRTAGELFGADRWTVAPALVLDYGARISRYDYLPAEGSLLSPRIGVAITPFSGTRVVASAEQRMLAPGAEEFLAPATVGPWLPPERTFAPLGDDELRVERGRFFDVGLEHDFDGVYIVGVRRFHQAVDNQMAALFGLPVDGGPNSPGHYYVATAGNVDADGWEVHVASDPSQRVRGSVEYTLTRARWLSRGDMATIALSAPEAIRPRAEDVHDITTSLETDIPETATHVFVLYKVNNAFARGADPTGPMLDYRFDVQVNQALPFMPLRNTRWEVLVGVRNLFRDPAEKGSIYDELLVVRPPTRVMGGVLVKF